MLVLRDRLYLEKYTISYLACECTNYLIFKEVIFENYFFIASKCYLGLIPFIA